MLKFNIGELNWHNFTQQKLMATTEDSAVALDNGVPHTAIVQRYTVIQLAFGWYLNVIH